MTFVERYNQESTWQGRAIVMEIFHLAACAHHKDWTVTKTAQYFRVSIGLVSENLRLASALHESESLSKKESRQDALKWLNNHRRVY